MGKQRKKSPGGTRSKAELDQHAAIRNPTSEGFWKSRGHHAPAPTSSQQKVSLNV